jgi:hypothetical protein
MPHTDRNRTYTFFMPGEERIFFRYFHVIAIALLLIIFFVRLFGSRTNTQDALVFALVLVLPIYLLRLIYGKRFVDSVTLDFDDGTVLFSFSDESRSFKKNFQDIRKIRFRSYLTFVLDDGRIMVKRPNNKKEAFRLLQKVSKVDSGIFAGF